MGFPQALSPPRGTKVFGVPSQAFSQCSLRHFQRCCDRSRDSPSMVSKIGPAEAA